MDELDERIRALEAERLRPVPPTPIMRRLPRSERERRSQTWDAGREDDLEEYMAALAARRALLEEVGDDEDDLTSYPQAVHNVPTDNLTGNRTTDPQAEARTIEVSETPSGGP